MFKFNQTSSGIRVEKGNIIFNVPTRMSQSLRPVLKSFLIVAKKFIIDLGQYWSDIPFKQLQLLSTLVTCSQLNSENYLFDTVHF